MNYTAARKLQERRQRREEKRRALSLVYAQLQAIIEAGRGSKDDEDEEASEAPSVSMQQNNIVLTTTTNVTSGLGRPTASAMRRYTNKDRRLPTIFQEQRQTTHNIDLLCTELKGQISKMEGEFGRRRRALQGSPLGDVRNRLVSRSRTPLTTTQLQKYKGRSDSPQDGDVSGGEGNDGNSGGVETGPRRGDIERVRVAAADEGLRDDQSVSDYAAEPDIPMYSPGRTLRDEVEAMDDSIKKVSQCMASMMLLEEMDSGNPWWESAMLVREMKACNIRANYHVRCVLKWIVRAQEHFLLEAVSKNSQSARCSEEMVYMREQVGLFSQRIEQSRKLLTEVEAEIANLKSSLNEATVMRNELLEQLLKEACESNMLPPGSTNLQSAELVMLLEYAMWPVSLLSDVERVKAWVQSQDTQLDV